LLFHPQDGLIAGMLDLEADGVLERREGELRFLDLRHNRLLPERRDAN
jgi:hypothetical protein